MAFAIGENNDNNNAWNLISSTLRYFSKQRVDWLEHIN